MSDKYIVTIDIDAKDKKNKIKYFLINKTKRKLHNLINNHKNDISIIERKDLNIYMN